MTCSQKISHDSSGYWVPWEFFFKKMRTCILKNENTCKSELYFFELPLKKVTINKLPSNYTDKFGIGL